jgi:hypothetical protein
VWFKLFLDLFQHSIDFFFYLFGGIILFSSGIMAAEEYQTGSVGFFFVLFAFILWNSYKKKYINQNRSDHGGR